MKGKILWVEGKRSASPSFIPGLRKKGLEITTVTTGRTAVEKVNSFSPDIVVINAASMRTSGKRICQTLHQVADDIPVILIVAEEHAKVSNECAETVLVLPFTIRKLVNRIKPYVPSETNNVYTVGKINLDLHRNRVHCMEKETSLTPRLTHLLKLLMENPGEVITREDLFKKVWETEYTGDTRTLDVHISWLRKAIEIDPRNPEILRTVRGVGYRLDLDT